MKMGETFPMNGGDDAYSYSKNSRIQKETSEFAKRMIQEAIIEKLEMEIPSTVQIADFGCSVGPNTLMTTQNLMEAVEKKRSKNNIIEFLVFFNDHIANDFNTLFASLPAPAGRKYYAAGVPGSFHGRLFPRGSITLAHSSFALHWLSGLPQGAWNEGRIFYAGEWREEVWRVYWEQFERDMGGFMSARAQEIVKGGLMFLILPGIGDGVCHAHLPLRLTFDLLHSSLMDLAREGVVEQAEVDAFNLPVYFPSVGEMRELIEKNGSFSVERVESTKAEVEISTHSMIMHLRAAFEGILTKHFGESVVNQIFTKTLAKAQQMHHQLQAAHHSSIQFCFVLKRK